MSGSIKGIITRPPQSSRAAAGGRAKGGSRSQPGKNSGDVAITGASIHLGHIERTLAHIPVIDGSRVENIREALADGTYEISPRRIADKLIEFELMLNRAERSYARRYT